MSSAKFWQLIRQNDGSMPRLRLTAKQQVFLERLLANGGNASEAYRRAFPGHCTASSVSAVASRLRRHPLILQALGAADHHHQQDLAQRTQHAANAITDHAVIR
jgi:hypothetical protein